MSDKQEIHVHVQFPERARLTVRHELEISPYAIRDLLKVLIDLKEIGALLQADRADPALREVLDAIDLETVESLRLSMP